MWPQTVPTPITALALMFVVIVTVTRIVLVRGVSPTDQLINALAVSCLIGVLLREPTIARLVMSFVPAGLPTLFDAWHWTTIFSWGCGLGILLVREYGPVRYKKPFRLVVATTIAIGIGFLVLSSPARSEGVSIAEYGGWRYGVYVGLLSAPPVFVSAYLLRTLVMLRRRVTTSREENVVRILFLVAILSMMPASSYLLLGALGISGREPAVTDRMYNFTANGLASGEPQLLFGAILVSVLVPSCRRAWVRVRQLRRLGPLWRDLTTAVPGVVLALRWADRWGAWPAERLERVKIEIRDASEIIAGTIVPLPAAIDRSIDNGVTEDDQENMRLVAELLLAVRSQPEVGYGRQSGGLTLRTSDLPDIDTLVRFWEPAKSLVHQSFPKAVESTSAQKRSV
ncbi:DUF6545 domain-containing protein [Nocardia sp. NBC_01327]|uniref:DUF6545 domain-containing protein n=1 Tax=Nocardia sp. NBC_01327 TaxID=2903593 RepID=UPI002E118D34|nr:hypothetical protein OG326_22440 [Nocardia sp. NBC_01327]